VPNVHFSDQIKAVTCKMDKLTLYEQIK